MVMIYYRPASTIPQTHQRWSKVEHSPLLALDCVTEFMSIKLICHIVTGHNVIIKGAITANY